MTDPVERVPTEELPEEEEEKMETKTSSSLTGSATALKTSGLLSHFIDERSATSSSLMAVQQELVCSVCLELFNDPVCLDCGHNVCYKCAHRLVAFAKACATVMPASVNQKAEAARATVEQAAQEAARTAGTLLVPSEENKREKEKENDTVEVLKELAEPVEPAVALTCPLCRVKTRLGDVKPNIVLRNMVADLRLRAPPSFMPELRQERRALEKEQEVLREQLRLRPHCGFCDKAATVYCADCGSLCAEHSAYLHSSGPLRFHDLSTAISPEVYCKTREIIFGADSAASFGSDFQMPPCPDHGKPTELFCTKCREAVCTHCLLIGAHHDHECVSMVEAFGQLDGWITELRAEVRDLLPACGKVAQAYEGWARDEAAQQDAARQEVHATFARLLEAASGHERAVCEHAQTLYDSFDENSRKRTEGIHVVLAHARELLANTGAAGRVSAFAQQTMVRELAGELAVLAAVAKSAPKSDAAVLTVEDHRRLLLDRRLVAVKRLYSFSGLGSCICPISVDSLLASRSARSDLECPDNSSHDGGAVIDVERRLIVHVSGNCNNGRDIFLTNIDTKRTERLPNAVPYRTHGQYPVFDGKNRVYFFQSEQDSNDRFGFFDLETRSFTELARVPDRFREFASPCFLDGCIYAACRDKYLWEYNVANETWTKQSLRVGKVRLAADPHTRSLVIIKKRSKFALYNLETKVETPLPVQPSNFSLGSNQEMLFIRTSPEAFVCIVSLDSHSMYAFTSKNNAWRRLNWKDVRNGSAHLVFDPVTSAFYYKIDGKSYLTTVPVTMD